MDSSEQPDPDIPRWVHGGHRVLPVWLAEFEARTETDALELAAEWFDEVGTDTLAVCCSDLHYCEDGFTVLSICYQPARASPGPVNTDGEEDKRADSKPAIENNQGVIATRYAKHARVLGKEREVLAAKVASAYRKGASIRDIAAVQQRSYGSIHRLLGEAGVELRPRGGYRRRS